MVIRFAAAIGIALAVPGGAAWAAPISAMATGTEDVSLHYLDFGGRGTPVILLAGAGNTAWIYGEFGPKLAKSHRVFALTRRGHGASGHPATGYSIELMVEDLRHFMDQRGLKRAILIGHSLAGAELTSFANKYPDRVGALVYLDAAYDRSTQEKVDAGDPVSSAPPTAADRRSVKALITFVKHSRPDLRRYWTDSVERDLRASIALRGDGTASWVTSPMFGEYWTSATANPPDYARIKGPALAIYAAEDESYRLSPNATAELKAKLQAYMQGPFAVWRDASKAQFRGTATNRQVVVMNAGHHLFIHHPARTLALIEHFLKRHKLD